MKKKVCVVTWSGGTNYGTNLQAYALLEKLKLLGYDAKLKGKIRGSICCLLHPMYVLDRVCGRIKSISGGKKAPMEDPEKAVQFAEFCRDHLPKLNTNGRKAWKQVEEAYTAFVTGSDQVWNPNYFQSMTMLDFIKTHKIRKIAYAPSIGVSELPQSIRRKYKKLISSYAAIGMREAQAARLISDISPVPVTTVLDPTLLLRAENWDLLADTARIRKAWGADKPYIVCYFVGHRNDYFRYVDLVRKETGMHCIVIPMDGDLSACGTAATGVGPKEFVWLIKHADIVCTDSYHAAVFSMLYQKEFYVLKRFDDSSKASQNGRLYELLDTYQLRSRWITEETEFHREADIDYAAVSGILNGKREYSEAFLINALEGRE